MYAHHRPKKKRYLTSISETLDMFGAPLPTFNDKGKTEVHTTEGFIVSVVLLTVLMMFGAMKMEHLVKRHNP